MDRWSGVLKVPLDANSRACYSVAVSLCLSPTSDSLSVPSANAIFFSGDRVSGTGNPVIERLSNLQNIAEILVSKLGGGCVNAWVVEASLFSGPFAVYKDFVPSVNQWGDPKSYDPFGFPASRSTVVLLSNCLREVKNSASLRQEESRLTPKTLIFGFSKGGTVLNQLVTELGFSDSCQKIDQDRRDQIIPATEKCLLNSIREIHYIDVGLNSVGAYVTNGETIERISRQCEGHDGGQGLRFVLHGTPRQWGDDRRPWIRDEKDQLLRLLRSGAQTSDRKLEVSERLYFGGVEPPDMQMHFEIIEKLDLS